MMTKEILLKHIQKLARPVVGLCLRHGIKLGELIDALKRIYVSCAEESLRKEGEAVSTSRITVMTGVHRTDVASIREEGSFMPRERHTASDVINQWRYDSRFSSGRGKPRALEIEGKNSEFAELVKSVSLSVSPYTVGFELERLGLIKRGKDGKARLLTRVFVPKGDPSAVLEMLAEDAEDLFVAVEENAFESHPPELPNHHLKTEYTNVSCEALPEIRRWFMREGSALHERARNFLSKFDRDLTPQDKPSTESCRVAIASFSRVEETRPEKSTSEDSKSMEKKR